MTISKIEFIKQKFPEIENIDPNTDLYFVRKVAKALYDNKFYKNYGEGVEFAACNLILKAKGTYQRRKVYKTNRIKDLKKP